MKYLIIVISLFMIGYTQSNLLGTEKEIPLVKEAPREGVPEEYLKELAWLKYLNANGETNVGSWCVNVRTPTGRDCICLTSTNSLTCVKDMSEEQLRAWNRDFRDQLEPLEAMLRHGFLTPSERKLVETRQRAIQNQKAGVEKLLRKKDEERRLWELYYRD